MFDAVVMTPLAAAASLIGRPLLALAPPIITQLPPNSIWWLQYQVRGPGSFLVLTLDWFSPGCDGWLRGVHQQVEGVFCLSSSLMKRIKT